MKPIIGINIDIGGGLDGDTKPAVYNIQVSYVQAIAEANGIPILLPPMPEADLDSVLSMIQGVVFIGGRDYSPSIYAEKLSPKADLIDNRREEFDLLLMQKALSKLELPLLAICGGHQLLNISLGGSLIQDIPSECSNTLVQHTKPKGSNQYPKHKVKLDPQSLLYRIYQAQTIDVPTNHHQSIKKLGDGLKPVAYADDDIIEAVELNGRDFVVGVQWHPEQDKVGNRMLFQEFIQQASKVKR